MDTSAWRVIVTDDEPDNVGVLELVLEFHGADVRIAESGAECLQLLNQEDQEAPSFLLVDIQMPGMTGYELLNKIRERRGGKDLPVIAVTAHTMSGDPEKIMAAGFDGYIAKPINALTIVDELKEILGKLGHDG